MRSPALSVLLATTLGAVPLLAQEVETAAKLEVPALPSAVEQAAQAQALYRTGMAASDPILVLAAAKLAAQVELVAGTPQAGDPDELQLGASADGAIGVVMAKKRVPPSTPQAPAPVMNIPDGAEEGVQRARKQPAGTTISAPAPVMKMAEAAEAEAEVERAKTQPVDSSRSAPAPMRTVPEGAEPGVQAGEAAEVVAVDDAPVESGSAADAARVVVKASFGASADTEAAGGALPDAEIMFASAVALAAGDAALLGVIEDAKAEAGRGSIRSAGKHVSRLAAGSRDVWKIAYAASSLAELAVYGNGAADLDIMITDAGGNVICYDVSRSDRFYCSWVPVWEGDFYITVENVGGETTTYNLLSN